MSVGGSTASRPPRGRVAIIGAGVAGLACARVLAAQGRMVTVFDRGRHPGGRLGARRISLGDRPSLHADHGAPFFTCADDRVVQHVRSWVEQGVCAIWRPDRYIWNGKQLNREITQESVFVGVPEMRMISTHLAAGVDVRTGLTVTGIDRTPAGWSLRIESRESPLAFSDPFDVVLMAAPPEQTARIFDQHSEQIRRELADATTAPCWAHTILLQDEVRELPGMLRVPGSGSVELVVHESAKPGRPRHQSLSLLVVYASAGWSASRYEADPAVVGREMTDGLLSLLRTITGRLIERSEFSPVTAHRWGLARTSSPVPGRCVVDADARLIACGDGFGGAGLESAFLSGHAAASAVLSFG